MNSNPFLPDCGFSEACLEHYRRVAFFRRRKLWAIERLKLLGVSKPGEKVEGFYEDVDYLITIGPRHGIRIKEQQPERSAT